MPFGICYLRFSLSDFLRYNFREIQMNKTILTISLSFLLINGAYPADAQSVDSQLARLPDKDSSSYQGLVRKNLELRKELQILEKKYVDLENLKISSLHNRRYSNVHG